MANFIKIRLVYTFGWQVEEKLGLGRAVMIIIIEIVAIGKDKIYSAGYIRISEEGDI